VDNCFKLLPRQALHAQTLGFAHPVNGKPMSFEAPLPNDMLTAIDKWRHYAKHRLD
jgi:23S rRNA pseudouridine1911/1915/1917 synthase